ncbi:MAG TPA: TMEM165/GDT1 family protein [Firmicutes bacterium]|nr:TMEM165/GDT1 family protein [Bacillota bacterium]
MFHEMVKAACLIFLAEMGDKTQLLAMAFALRFSIGQVLVGVALGAFLNHGLAVMIGAYLGAALPLEVIKLGSAVLFLCFGVWTLFSRTGPEEEEKRMRGNPVLVVALAFFIGELGDKTQLTAIALASGSQHAWAVLSGTVLGMVLTSLVGIIVGAKLGERIPEFALRLISGGVFIGFGLFHLEQSVQSGLIDVGRAGLILVIPLFMLLFFIIPPLRLPRRTTNLKEAARRLHALERALDDLCLAETRCRGKHCPVGYCRQLVKEALADNMNGRARFQIVEPYLKNEQHFDPAKVEQVWAMLENLDPGDALYPELRANLEKIRRNRP